MLMSIILILIDKKKHYNGNKFNGEGYVQCDTYKQQMDMVKYFSLHKCSERFFLQTMYKPSESKYI